MKRYIEKLRSCLTDGSPQSILNMLFDAYNEINRMDDDKIKQDFHELYEQMNGMSLQEMDKIIYPVCKLCRDHQCVGFTDGIRIGVLLVQELKGVVV